MKRVDLVGNTYGLLVVVRAATKPRYYEVRCNCGEEKQVYGPHLTRGKIKSCGCIMKSAEFRERQRRNAKRHGHAAPGNVSPTWSSWSAMRSRCENPNAVGYKWYGGRGITVCDRWSTSFENFLADMGERPLGTSIDRIDTNGNYEPGNCRWATDIQQARSRRNSFMTKDRALEILGRHAHGQTQRSIGRQMGVDQSVVSRLVNLPAEKLDAYLAAL